MNKAGGNSLLEDLGAVRLLQATPADCLSSLSQCVCNDYENVTPLEWAEYEFASIEYDYKIPAGASKAIRAIFNRLSRPRARSSVINCPCDGRLCDLCHGNECLKFTSEKLEGI